ncbi:MAG TPA: hypothetical protein P5121_09475 [Caldilineaceae bacterium]|nr:hypothetical protein [Caldilineaceae bacterium]
MKKRTKPTKFIYIMLMVLGLLSLAGAYTMHTTFASVLPQTPRQILRQIWVDASNAQRYDYDSSIVQTINPLPRIDNVGRMPQTVQMSISGQLDRQQQAMQLQLRLPNQPPLEVKIEDGVTKGRLSPDAEWQTVEAGADLFAPGGDPLGYLVAIKNVQTIASNAATQSESDQDNTLFPSALLPEQIAASITRYSFDIDGPAYAEYMRRALAEQLRRRGELPVSIQLSSAQQYVAMTGQGELWVNSDGLPVRQLVRLSFPPKSYAKDWVQAEIHTDFRGWMTKPLVSLSSIWQQPTQITTYLAQASGLTGASIQQFGYMLGLSLLLLAFALLTITHRHSRFVQIPLVNAVIIAMVLTPVLQTQQASAFYDTMERRTLDHAANNPAEATEEAAQSAFNPHKNPLEGVATGIALAADKSANETSVASPATSSQNSQSAAPAAQTAAADCIITDDSDCDGLTDMIEMYELGTWIDDVDSDDDGISDLAEVLPFTVNGQTWYLDPRNSDTNSDGMIDLLECPERHDMQTDGAIDGSVTLGNCRDTDGDGAPDVYDHDNDGDGVPDSADISPFRVESVPDGQLDLTLNNVANGSLAVVDLHIRPTDPRNLWYVDNVLNWSGSDDQGQIKRVNPDTFRDGDGDMLLSPMLEIEIPFDEANPTRSLPISATIDVSAATPLDQWLDQGTLDQYGINASLNEDDGTIWLYVPVAQVQDPIGYAPVALSARIPYLQQAGEWGTAHKIKLLWTLSMQNDQQINGVWTSNNVIVESYYDDFMLTGLNVEEAHGADTLVIAQSPSASGGNANYDNYLLHVADVLQSAFLQGEHKADGNRLTVADIGDYLTTWGIPANALIVDKRALGLADEVAVASTLNDDQVKQILTNVYGASPAADTIGNLLLVNEFTQRSASFSDAVMNSGQLTIALADPSAGIKTDTVGTIMLKPYLYDSAEGWVDINPTSYVEAVDANWQTFYTDQRLQSLSTETLIDVEHARAGAVLLLKGYYEALLTGIAGQLVINSEALGVADLANTLYQYDANNEPAITIPKDLLAGIQQFYADSSLDNVAITTVDDEIDPVSNAIWALLGASSAQTLNAIGSVAAGDQDSATSKALLEYNEYSLPISAEDLIGNHANVYIFQSLSASLGGTSLLGISGKALSVAGTSGMLALRVLLQKSYLTTYTTWKAARFATQAASLGELTQLSNTIQEMHGKWKLGAAFALAIPIGLAALSIGFGLGSGEFAVGTPDFENLLADKIAGIIVGALFAALSMVPGGQLIMGAIGIIDSLFSLGCAIAGAAGAKIKPAVDTWVCGGLTQAFTEALSYALHDFTPLIDLQHADRLGVELATPLFVPTSGKTGTVSGNDLQVSGVITSTLYANKPTWMGYIYDWQLDDNYLDNATFDYRFQSAANDVSLDRGGTSWIALDGTDGARFYQTFTPSSILRLGTAGINEPTPGYLTESFAMEAQSCWLIPNPYLLPPAIPTCWLQEYEDNFHNPLNLVFDILPATLNAGDDGTPGLHTLAEVSDGSYRLAWDEQFPVMADADNDGLRSKAVGGTDPDDSTPDTDGDGLSDWYEATINFDAKTADGDCDGLTDYWELLYGTNPYLADSDSDGLYDSAEMLHPNRRNPYENGDLINAAAPTCAPAAVEKIPVTNGDYIGGWEIVYDYDENDNPRYFWVNADPIDGDSDGDELSDRKEYVYGYHPQVPSSLDVLALDTTIAPSSGAAPYVKPGDTINYSATVRNELRNRYARGLLQAELPVDEVIQTRVLADGELGPQESTTMAGAVNVAINSSLATSMTIRAGAVIVPDDDKLLLHLPFSEAAGATSFRDVTIPRTADFVCVTAGCTTANGSYLTFAGSNDTFIKSVETGLTDPNRFTVAFWVDTGPLLGNSAAAIRLGNAQLDIAGYLISYVSGQTELNGFHPSADRTDARSWDPSWTHVALAVDGTNGALYVNGVLVKSGTVKATSVNEIQIGGRGGAAIDNLYLYDDVLDITAIRQLPMPSDLQLSLTLSPNASNTDNIACSGNRCPSVDAGGARFLQAQNIAVTDDALGIAGDEFTFSLWLDPDTRQVAFDTDLVRDPGANFAAQDPYNHDQDQDWQGVFGHVANGQVYPSMFVSDAGRLRMVWGSVANTCIYTSAPGLITYDGLRQHVTVAYARETAALGTLVLYINGQEVDRGTVENCSAIDPGSSFAVWNALDIGRPNNYGYFYFRTADYANLVDSGDDAELCLNFDADGDQTSLWHDYNLSNFASITHASIVTLKRIEDDNTNHWFRLQEDDGLQDDCVYESVDDEHVYRTSLSNVSPLGDFNEQISGFELDGELDWSLSNDFFHGELRDFHKFSYAFTANEAFDLYRNNRFSLLMTLDAAPGEMTFLDSSGNYLEATCAGASCPDSGIPGRNNQALRFDGGVADDDGNDGVADYLKLNVTDTELGLSENNFTVMAWVKPDTASTQQTILAAERTSDPSGSESDGFSFGLTNGKPRFITWSVQGYTASSAAVPAGVWSHVAAVMDANNNVVFYVNGKLVETVAGTKPMRLNSDDTYRIGSSTTPNSSVAEHPFDGLIDDVRVLKYAADAAAVQQLMSEAPLVNLHLDEDIGTTSYVNDSTLSGSAICSGNACPGAGDKGQIRESATFDGINDMLEVNDTANLSLNTFTVALWVKPRQQKTVQQPLIYKAAADSSTDRTFGLFIAHDSMRVLHSLQRGDCGAYASGNSNGSLLQNQWNHVVMTYDGQQNKLYINGSLDNTVDYVGTPCDQGNIVRLGAATQYTPFAGNLDEVTVQAGALSQSEVTALYDYQSSWFDIKEQHEIRVDIGNPTIALDYALDVVGPGQVIAFKIEDPYINDIASGIGEVQILFNDDATAYDVEVEYDGCWCFAFPSTLTGQTAYLTVNVKDRVGNANSESFSFNIDNAAPTIDVDAALIDGTIKRATTTLALHGTTTDAKTHVEENSVYVQLSDPVGEPVSGYLTTTVSSASAAGATQSWQTTQTFDNVPYGAYQLTMRAADIVDNQVETTAPSPLLLDGIAPMADSVTANDIITSGNQTFSGIVSDVPYPVGNSRLVHLHFEEAAGASSFVNGTLFGPDGNGRLTATCSGDSCPTAGVSGPSGSAVQFDGSNDYLSMPAVVNPADGPFTAMAWFKTASHPVQSAILQQVDGSGTGRSWLYIQRNGWLGTFLGGTGMGGAPTTDNTWQHAAVSYDGTTVKLYLNGEMVISANKTMESNDGAMLIGRNKSGGGAYDGAVDEVAIYSRALSDAEIYNIANPLDVGVAQTQVRYRHLSGASWPDVDPDGVALYLPLDERATATTFVDLSVNRLFATCTGGSEQCPVAGVDGQNARALAFDGDDYLDLPFILDPNKSSLTVSLWFKASDLSGEQVLLEQIDESGAQRTWLGLRGGELFTFISGGYLSAPGSVRVNTWHHATLTWDRAFSVLNIDLDGNRFGAGVNMPSTTGEMLIGTDATKKDFFRGAIDEVVIFERMPRSFDELAAIQNATSWSDVTLASTVNPFTTWSDTPSQVLEGPYKVDLFTTDAVGNSVIVEEAWSGAIDNASPRLIFNYVPDADYRIAQARCIASDAHLAETGWSCPVDDSYRKSSYQSASWYTDIITDVQMLTQFDTNKQSVSVEPNPSMTACDLYGQCTTASASVAVLEAIAAAQGGAQAATVSAAAVAADAGTSVSVYSALQLVNTPIELSTSFAAFDAARHTAIWHWGDGSTSPATVDAASGMLSGSHAYAAADIYAAHLEVTENAGDVVAFTVPFDVVVYDPDAGKTAGGGKIDSPAGAYKLDESISGLADFNLPVDYQSNATQPKGNFRFELPAAGMDFVATDYEWLIVYPDGTAMAKGVGTLNGQALNANGSPYRFWFWATDSSTDSLRVRIWTEDDSQYIWWQDAGGEVIYDNGSELPINNGNVQVIVSNGNGNGNGNGEATQVDDASTDSPVVEELSLDHQIFLPLITSNATTTAPAADGNSSESIPVEVDILDTDPAEIVITETDPVEDEPIAAQQAVAGTHQIFLPVVVSAD